MHVIANVQGWRIPARDRAGRRAGLLALLGLACAGPPVRSPGASARAGALALTDWRATNSIGTAGASLFGRVESTMPDTLLAVRADGAERVMLHGTSPEGRMVAAGPLVVQPGAPLRLQDRGTHAMIEALGVPLRAGDSLTVHLTFARAGTVTLRVPVVRLTEAATELK